MTYLIENDQVVHEGVNYPFKPPSEFFTWEAPLQNAFVQGFLLAYQGTAVSNPPTQYSEEVLL